MSTHKSPVSIAKSIYRRVPYVTKRIVREIGWEAAMRFMRHQAPEIGRRCVYIPKSYNSKNPLFKGLSEEHGKQLVEVFGGELLSLYDNSKLEKFQRNQEIIDGYRKGLKPSELATKHKISVRHCERIIKTYFLDEDDTNTYT